MKNLILIAALMVSAAAHAELGKKAPLKADFNALITNSYHERSDLANGVNDSIEQNVEPVATSNKADTQRVTDFVDVEIGWGQAPAVVDRRFDSVAAPVVAGPANTHVQ